MEVLPSALKHQVDPDDMNHALSAALVVEQIGEDPSRYLVLGPDRSGNLLELVVLDRPSGPVLIHAMAMRKTYRTLATEEMVTMPTTHGRFADGRPIDDAAIQAMADEAEAGYDVDALVRRRGGRPMLGSAPASVESVRLDPELKGDLLVRAAAEGISVSEAIRRAVRQYVQAS